METNKHAYHLDQNLRGKVSKGYLKTDQFLEEIDNQEAILPFALLEYAGIPMKEISQNVSIPQPMITEKPLQIDKIKKHLENEFKKVLPKKTIEKKLLGDRIQNDNEYARRFAKKCKHFLQQSGIYNILIAQLSWDRFSQMKWCKDISDSNLLKDIRTKIAKFISKELGLYALRYFHYLSTIPSDTSNDPPEIREYQEIIKKVKIKPHADFGDCELIHTAINGQSSPADHKNRKAVNCYTMDPAKEIKRRLTLCLFCYKILLGNSSNFQYTFDSQYYGDIYIIDETGKRKEKIKVQDYEPIRVVEKIDQEDLEILFLLNN